MSPGYVKEPTKCEPGAICFPVGSASAPTLGFFEDELEPVSQINIFLPMWLLVRLFVIATGSKLLHLFSLAFAIVIFGGILVKHFLQFLE